MKPSIVPVTLSGSPQDVFARIGATDGSALLESSLLSMPELGAWSWIAGPALATLETRGRDCTTLRGFADRRVIERWTDPFDAIQAVLDSLASCAFVPDERPAGLAFAGGLIGFLGYDLARFVECLPELALDDPPLPTMRLYLCDHVLAFDHARAQWYFCTLPCALRDVRERAAVWAGTLARARTAEPAQQTHFRAGAMSPRTPNARYLAQVQQVLDWIAAGDIFQANLSHRMEGTFEGNPFALYRALMQRNPAPFAAYLPGDGFAIASASPERFLKLDRGLVTARPIKGTSARNADAQRDAQAGRALQASTKDRAENLMIVDLMRNDLGRVAQTGSVSVPALFEIEAHPSVWQLVSTVQARLREGAGVGDLLRACWPPGSMTGAPKVRAMQIIESLEPVRRGPYAGAIGYFDAGGAMDLSVVIRTAVIHGQRVMLQLGGAVVADSTPQQELEETLAKGRLLLQALQG